MPRTTTQVVYRFGSCALDPQTGELRREGMHVRLRPQPARLLEHLLQRPFELLSRAELCLVLWPDGTFVHFNHGLNSCMKQIRAALHDDADQPRYIETLPRRGYRLIVPVLTGEPQATEAYPSIGVTVAAPRVLSFGEEARQFSEALIEDVTARLAGMTSVAVVVDAPDRSVLPPAAIGGAAALSLRTSVRLTGGRFRVIAQLVDLRSRTHRWADTFNGDLSDSLSATARIAHEIAAAVSRAARADRPAAGMPDAHGGLS